MKINSAAANMPRTGTSNSYMMLHVGSCRLPGRDLIRGILRTNVLFEHVLRTSASLVLTCDLMSDISAKMPELQQVSTVRFDALRSSPLGKEGSTCALFH